MLCSVWPWGIHAFPEWLDSSVALPYGVGNWTFRAGKSPYGHECVHVMQQIITSCMSRGMYSRVCAVVHTRWRMAVKPCHPAGCMAVKPLQTIKCLCLHEWNEKLWCIDDSAQSMICTIMNNAPPPGSSGSRGNQPAFKSRPCNSCSSKRTKEGHLRSRVTDADPCKNFEVFVQ